jgi:hypothetical protein
MLRYLSIFFAAGIGLGISSPALASSVDEAWAFVWNGPANHNDQGRLVASDPAGPLYVAGTTYEGGVGGDREDFFLQRFDTAGNLQWTTTYGGEGYDVPSGLGILPSGDIVVTGFAWDAGQNTVTTIRYQATGDTLWTRSFPLAGGLALDTPPRLAQDPSPTRRRCSRTPIPSRARPFWSTGPRSPAGVG